jgi:formylglycine-generating enzyme required for sulfatase activity
MADIFLSYKKEDRDLTKAYVKSLEEAGFSVWWDNRIEAGETWDEKIEAELNAAKAVVVLWTPKSVRSRWVKEEARVAQGANKLCPVLAESCQIPMGFGWTQCANLVTWTGAPEHEEWTKLVRRLSDICQSSTAHSSSAPAEPIPDEAGSHHSTPASPEGDADSPLSEDKTDAADNPNNEGPYASLEQEAQEEIATTDARSVLTKHAQEEQERIARIARLIKSWPLTLGGHVIVLLTSTIFLDPALMSRWPALEAGLQHTVFLSGLRQWIVTQWHFSAFGSEWFQVTNWECAWLGFVSVLIWTPISAGIISESGLSFRGSIGLAVAGVVWSLLALFVGGAILFLLPTAITVLLAASSFLPLTLILFFATSGLSRKFALQYILLLCIAIIVTTWSIALVGALYTQGMSGSVASVWDFFLRHPAELFFLTAIVLSFLFAHFLQRRLDKQKTDVTVRAFKLGKEAAAQDGQAAGPLVSQFAKGEQELAKRAIRSGTGELDQMVQIPAGEFKMGEENGYSSERPQHLVRVAAFELGKYPVTIEEYNGFCEATGRRTRTRAGSKRRHPIRNVSWVDAQAYVDWLNSWTEGGYRLPSEAEWEYACRAGTTTRWSCGDDLTVLGEYGWFNDNSEFDTHPVGEKRPNAWGLHDMHGNVGEWCEDNWHENYERAPDDGAPWIGGEGPLSDWRVLRGGYYYSAPDEIRSASRKNHDPSDRDDNVGFRVARTI